ncbi:MULTISPECIES: aminodeoxychorismate lyase [unclassified Halorhodospira]|uniref:aminodeoxychorismate lyase n=1 Tax=unclassified Halorhodospira TaxID=2626748 RepID=UPI001EE7F4F5|nr:MULTISPECIES: aminodeoxychorismate lyase [unclassified Halorhodospira]MCG5539814.1 aminodeoxychorismate lyase [Halorhodospira sp. M39old]MCG5544736.1 aminodeoxychorismate lyase [Halorhodospira sp. M38]
MSRKQLVNGRADTALDAEDRGLAYGDGLFETIAVNRGRLCLWDYHMDRLLDGARQLGLPEPPLATLREEARFLTEKVESGVLKVVYTRGSSEGRGYLPPSRPIPTRILTLHNPPAIPPERWQGVDVRLCRTRISAQPRLAGIKHLNRLEQVMARSEWRDAAIAEGLMLDADGLIVEGTATNVFAVRNWVLLTPPLTHSGVAGVMRRWIVEQAEAFGLRVEKRGFYPGEFAEMDEVFLTNSLIGLWPVRSVAGTWVPVGKVSRGYLEQIGSRGLTPLVDPPEVGGEGRW